MLEEARRLVFFGGKGGVGKTTLAAAFALLRARAGERTLLISTDPAHSTSDLLARPLGADPSRIEENLWAVEIDAASEAGRYIDRIKDDARDAVSPEVLATVDRQLDLAKSSPGTEESALFDRFVDLIARCPADFDYLIFDTAPTGHTLRLLTLPALLTTWVRGVVRQRERVSGIERMLHNLAGRETQSDESDPVLRRLRERHDRFHAARHRLLEDARFHLALIPERLPIEETVRAAETLEAQGIEVGALLVNRVLPADLDESDFMRARLAQQGNYLAEIHRRFAGRERVLIAHDPRDITRMDQLQQIADQLHSAGIA